MDMKLFPVIFCEARVGNRKLDVQFLQDAEVKGV